MTALDSFEEGTLLLLVVTTRFQVNVNFTLLERHSLSRLMLRIAEAVVQRSKGDISYPTPERFISFSRRR